MSFYSGFAAYYEQVFPFREEVYTFLREHAGQAGGAILDAGCGPGHYCGRFIHDGFGVSGIDLDSTMIETAATAYPQGVFQCMDITGLGSLHRHFQLIYSIGNVVSHLPVKGVEDFLDSAYAALEPGGSWIFQVVNWDYLLKMKEYTFPEKVIAEGSAVFCRRYCLISSERTVFDVQLTAGSKTVFHDQTLLYPLTSEAFIRLHESAGFFLKGLYAGFDKSRFNKDRDSGLVMVFTKQ